MKSLTKEQIEQVYKHLTKEKNWKRFSTAYLFDGECWELKEVLFELLEEKKDEEFGDS